MEIPAYERRRELACETTCFWYHSSHRAENVALLAWELQVPVNKRRFALFYCMFGNLS